MARGRGGTARGRTRSARRNILQDIQSSSMMRTASKEIQLTQKKTKLMLKWMMGKTNEED